MINYEYKDKVVGTLDRFLSKIDEVIDVYSSKEAYSFYYEFLDKDVAKDISFILESSFDNIKDWQLDSFDYELFCIMQFENENKWDNKIDYIEGVIEQIADYIKRVSKTLKRDI